MRSESRGKFSQHKQSPNELIFTWTKRVMGPLLSTSKISPFLVPTRMWPWPRDMARMEGLSSNSSPVKSMNYGAVRKDGKNKGQDGTFS